MNNGWWIAILIVASLSGYYVGYQDGVDNPPVYEDYTMLALESDRYIALLESRNILMNTLISNMEERNDVLHQMLVATDTRVADMLITRIKEYNELVEKMHGELKANKLLIDSFQNSTSVLEYSQLAP